MKLSNIIRLSFTLMGGVFLLISYQNCSNSAPDLSSKRSVSSSDDGDVERQGTSDTMPDAFMFNSVNNAQPGAETKTSAVITGIDSEVEVSLSGDSSGFIEIDGQRSTSGRISNGERLTVGVMAKPNQGQTATLIISVGLRTVSFSVTTESSNTSGGSGSTSDNLSIESADLVIRRCYMAGTHNHFFTSSEGCEGNTNSVEEGAMFQAASQPLPNGNSSLVHRCVRESGQIDHLATGDPDECNNLPDWRHEGGSFYLAISPSGDFNIPVYRCYHPPLEGSPEAEDHMLTTVLQECENAGYTYEGILGYATVVRP